MVLATEGPRVGHSEANRYRCRETRCTIVSVTRSLWQYTPATTIRLVIIPFGDAYYSAHDLLRLLYIPILFTIPVILNILLKFGFPGFS